MATALKRQKKPKLGETELLMLYRVAIYEVEFRRINAIEQQPFIWCESGFVLNEQERELQELHGQPARQAGLPAAQG